MLNEKTAQIVERIKKLQQRVDERRNVWSQTTKPQIKKFLEQICKEIDLDLRVAENDLRKNFSSVQLSFDIVPSGVIEHTPGGGMQSFIKEGGYLNFAQTMSGKIVVAVIYPFVEKFDEQPAPLFIARHEPEEISQDVVMTYVVRFLEEIAKWEENWSTPNAQIEI